MSGPRRDDLKRNHLTAKGAAFQVRTDPHEALKAWLRRYGELQTDASRLYDRAGELRGRIQSARTANLDGLPHAQSGDNDRIGADIARLEELEREAAEAQQEATAARRELETAIRRITGPRWADRREVLRLRYLDGLRWEDASEKLYGDDPNFWDKPEAFLRRTFKLHGKALEELSKIVPFREGQEIITKEDDRI